jgi:hypothetical protein
MSEQGTTGDRGEWQRTCEECGTELESVQLDFTEAEFSEGRTGTPLARDICPNPDCPRHLQDVGTSAARGDEAATLPGSLGGDNGGA